MVFKVETLIFESGACLTKPPLEKNFEKTMEMSGFRSRIFTLLQSG